MRAEKQLLLDEIKEKIEQSGGIFLTRYRGLKASGSEEVRSRLRKIGGDWEGVRKRVFMKAAAEAGVEVDPSMLEGHIAVVFAGEDVVETTKTLVDFAKESNGVVEVIAARFGGQSYSASDVQKLAKLPGLQELRAQVLALFEAPMSQTVGVMQAVLTSLLYAMENRREAMA